MANLFHITFLANPEIPFRSKLINFSGYLVAPYLYVSGNNIESSDSCTTDATESLILSAGILIIILIYFYVADRKKCQKLFNQMVDSGRLTFVKYDEVWTFLVLDGRRFGQFHRQSRKMLALCIPAMVLVFCIIVVMGCAGTLRWHPNLGLIMSIWGILFTVVLQGASILMTLPLPFKTNR